MSENYKLSIVIPAKNEAAGLDLILPKLFELYPEAEVIVVDDGSADDTAIVAESLGAKVHRHPYPMGNGAAIKSGARAASGDVIIFMDGDGQHRPDDIPRLLEQVDFGFDMVVGARNDESQASFSRFAGNKVYNALASFVVNNDIKDLTSGFRAVKREKFLEFLYMLPNGFSYPTTITMAFFRAGYSVCYIPIVADKRLGSSHLNLIRDGIKFLLIIFKVGTLYSPLKIFFPMALGFFVLGFCHYAYTFSTLGRFTNMSALLFICGMLVFVMGLISEQVTTLLYKNN